ncbi:MAG: PE-PGRS family protein [Pseudomonadales bacterium]|nr:hypothetical protein [Halioglobus sp.]MCP5129893.1 PE-PGRS family protein [Pseudomonadales bacterium]
MRAAIVKAAGLLGVCLLVSLLLGTLLLDRPVTFAIDQLANHHYHHGQGLRQRLAAALINTGIASDWAHTSGVPVQVAPFPLLLSAANPDNHFPYQAYSLAGTPLLSEPGQFLTPAGTRDVRVGSVAEMSSAIASAVPGDVITLAPGIYDIADHTVVMGSAGLPALPIYLRADVFGEVLIRLDTLVGFEVSAPFWVIENLRIRGNCKDDSHCEHAFHVVGEGGSFTLRNSEMVNFNAPLKVNMQTVDGNDRYPDGGLVEYNNFYNEAPRNTDNPVTLLNINSADDWVVRGNYIADFAKNGGDHTSYAAFFKGNSRKGIFERNLVICEHRLPADEGIRVGLSFGGGGTAQEFCREGSCAVENSESVMRNNIIMNCSRDVGIYLNRAAQANIHHNLLYNNLGIDVRFETSSARITNNIISGRIRDRDNGRSIREGNIIARDCLDSSRFDCEFSDIYRAPGQVDFRLKSTANRLGMGVGPTQPLTEDFCGHTRPSEVMVGPVQYPRGLDCLAQPAAD